MQYSHYYIEGIKEGRAYLNNNPDVESDKDAMQCHIDTLSGLIKDNGFSGDMKDLYKGERDFWRNQLKKGKL